MATIKHTDLWEWLLVVVVIVNEHTIDVETYRASYPCSSNGCFHNLMRAKVVHTSLDCSGKHKTFILEVSSMQNVGTGSIKL